MQMWLKALWGKRATASQLSDVSAPSTELNTPEDVRDQELGEEELVAT